MLKLIRLLLVIFVSLLFGYEIGIAGSMLQPTSVKYEYRPPLGLYGIASGATAFNGDILIGKAEAIELQAAESGPKILEIKVTHYSISGNPVYEGYIYIQAGFGGGKVIREKKISGTKKLSIFTSWQFGVP